MDRQSSHGPLEGIYMYIQHTRYILESDILPTDFIPRLSSDLL